MMKSALMHASWLALMLVVAELGHPVLAKSDKEGESNDQVTTGDSIVRRIIRVKETKGPSRESQVQQAVAANAHNEQLTATMNSDNVQSQAALNSNNQLHDQADGSNNVRRTVLKDSGNTEEVNIDGVGNRKVVNISNADNQVMENMANAGQVFPSFGQPHVQQMPPLMPDYYQVPGSFAPQLSHHSPPHAMAPPMIPMVIQTPPVAQQPPPCLVESWLEKQVAGETKRLRKKVKTLKKRLDELNERVRNIEIAQAKSKSKCKSKSKSESKPESKSESKPESKSKSKPESKSKSKPESKSKSKPESESKSKPKDESEPKKSAESEAGHVSEHEQSRLEVTGGQESMSFGAEFKVDEDIKTPIIPVVLVGPNMAPAGLANYGKKSAEEGSKHVVAW